MIKKFIAVILTIIILTFCASCDYSVKDTSSLDTIPSYAESSSDNTSNEVNSNFTEITPDTSSAVSSSNDTQEDLIRDMKMKAVWIEYTDKMFSKVDKNEFINLATERFSNIKNAGFNTVILHTRSNADAIYPSSYFPFNKSLTGVLSLGAG